MNKIRTLFLCLFLFPLMVQAAEPMPFYFFRLLPKKLPNILNKQEAQKRLCKFIPDHCVLPDEKEYKYPEEMTKRMQKINPRFGVPKDLKLKYSVEPLYKSSDIKSEIVGVFVNAVSSLEQCRVDPGHCYESALASYVMNKNGVRRELGHYVGESWSMVTKHSPTELARKQGAGVNQNTFYAYIRAMDAIPNEPLSQHAKPKDHWYALANPDGKGGKLWFRYKSDLRTPKFTRLMIEKGSHDDFIKKLKNKFGYNMRTSDGSFVFCRYLNNKVTLTSIMIEPYSIYEDLVEKHNSKIPQELNSKSDICSSNTKDYSPQEAPVDLSEFYENGFLKSGFGLFGIEVTYFVEFQNVLPSYSKYGDPMKPKK